MLGSEFDVILEDAQRGACSACTRIYEALAPPVTGYLRAQGAEEPDDLASEVFLRVFSSCGSFSGNEAQFRAWVFTIAHSRLVDARRVRNRSPEMVVLEDELLEGQCPCAPGADEEAMGRMAVYDVQQMLAALTTDQGEVLALRLMSQMSVEEVAGVLDKPPGAVKALQRRALATLRRKLGAEAVPR